MKKLNTIALNAAIKQHKRAFFNDMWLMFMKVYNPFIAINVSIKQLETLTYKSTFKECITNEYIE